MDHVPLTLEEIQNLLREKAEKRFGTARADALRADINQTAAELLKVLSHPIDLEDEP